MWSSCFEVLHTLIWTCGIGLGQHGGSFAGSDFWFLFRGHFGVGGYGASVVQPAPPFWFPNAAVQSRVVLHVFVSPPFFFKVFWCSILKEREVIHLFCSVGRSYLY